MQSFNNANRVAHISHGIFSGSIPTFGAIPVSNGPVRTNPRTNVYVPNAPSVAAIQPARMPSLSGSSYVQRAINTGYRPSTVANGVSPAYNFVHTNLVRPGE
jgi:hypothetical protein